MEQRMENWSCVPLCATKELGKENSAVAMLLESLHVKPQLCVCLFVCLLVYLFVCLFVVTTRKYHISFQLSYKYKTWCGYRVILAESKLSLTHELLNINWQLSLSVCLFKFTNKQAMISREKISVLCEIQNNFCHKQKLQPFNCEV